MHPPKSASPVTAGNRREDVVRRVRGEYLEMPGLCLTVAQACRLWQIDPVTCTRILDVLVAERFLTRTTKGTFIASP